MSHFPEMLVQTPVGHLKAWATSEGHIGFATSGNLNVERKEGEAQKTIMVNGVALTFRMDVTVSDSTSGGRWGVKEIAPGWFLGHQDLSLNRADRYESASPAARAKVEKLMIPWVVQFMASAEGQALFAQAGGKRREDRLAAINAKLDEMRIERSALLAEKASLESQAVSV